MVTGLGLDIGGTEVKGGIVDTATGKLLQSFSVPTNAQKGLQGIKAAIAGAVSHLKSVSPESKEIGVASAGNIDSLTGTVVYATDNLPGYTGFKLAEFIKSTADLTARCDNDAYSALKGEARYGGARGLKNVAMLTLGTGVGGAVMLDGKIYRGSNFDAARFGHIILYPDGIKCTCGQNGCAESYVSGTALMKQAEARGLNVAHGSEIFEKSATDKTVKAIVDSFIKNLSALILTLKNTFAPDACLIGGGVINSEAYFLSDLQKACPQIPILPAQLTNTAGIVGATLYD